MTGPVRELRARINRLDKELCPEDTPGADGAVYAGTMRGLMLEAEALGDPSLLLRARLAYSYALRFKPFGSGRDAIRKAYRERLVVLRRCLGSWEELRDDGNVDAMWEQVLDVVDGFIRFFTEPFDLVADLLDDLERRCPPSRADTLYHIHKSRMALHARRGDITEAERLYRDLQSRPDPKRHLFADGMRAVSCTMWQRLGRDDLALEAIAPVLNGQVPVREGRVYTDTPLMAYLRTGRIAEAVEAHQSTYALPGKKLEEIAAHLEFCARTGNIERGLDVLHRNLRSFMGPKTYEHTLTKAAAALLCRRVCELDRDRHWIWPCHCDEHTATTEACRDPGVLYTYAQLGADLRWQAINFIWKVSDEDGTDFAITRLHELLTADPIADGLELPPDTAEPHRPVPSASKHLPARTPEELTAALAEARALGHNQAQGIALAAVVQNALTAGDPEAVLEARLGTVDELSAGRPGWRTTLFAHLSALAGTDPDLFGAERAARLWNAVPVTLDQALTRATVHVNQVGGLIERLLPHVRPGTDDLHHLCWYATELAARRGDVAAARDAWAAYVSLPPRDVYNAPGDVRRRVTWWLDLGCDDEAEAAASEGCEELLLMPYLRSGRADLARETHERTWHDASTRAGVAAHLEYCARTGRLERGKQIVQRNLALFEYPWNDSGLFFDQLRCDAALGLLCAEIVAAGTDETWTWICDCCKPEDDWTYARLGKDEPTFRHRWEELTGTRFHSGRHAEIAARHPDVPRPVHKGA